jgi:hypothetical protein
MGLEFRLLPFTGVRIVTDRSTIEAAQAMRAARFPRPGVSRQADDARPGRLGQRLLGTALLVASIGLASCHGFVLAIFG